MFAALTTIGVSAVDDKEPPFSTSPYPYNDEDGVAIVGFNETAFDENGKVTIPAEIDGEPVLALGLECALECIPGVEKIQELDLTRATNLKVILPYAFSFNHNFKGPIESDTVEVVSDQAFDCCNNLQNLDLPALEIVGNMAFGRLYRT